MAGPVFLDGDDVQLRTIEEEDLSFLQAGVNDPQVWRAIGRPHPVNGQQEREFFDEVASSDDSVDLLVTVDGDRAGIVSLWLDDGHSQNAELGYWIDPDHHRQGYASEAADLLTTYGFRQLALHRIEARVFEFNDPSQRVLESLGFRHEGTHREAVYIDGAYQDVLWYGLLVEDTP